MFIDEAFFGAGNGSIYLDDVICSGSESTILQCNHSSIGHHNCHHGEDVIVFIVQNQVYTVKLLMLAATLFSVFASRSI